VRARSPTPISAMTQICVTRRSDITSCCRDAYLLHLDHAQGTDYRASPVSKLPSTPNNGDATVSRSRSTCTPGGRSMTNGPRNHFRQSMVAGDRRTPVADERKTSNLRRGFRPGLGNACSSLQPRQPRRQLPPLFSAWPGLTDSRPSRMISNSIIRPIPSSRRRPCGPTLSAATVSVISVRLAREARSFSRGKNSPPQSFRVQF
jgi:hypothetical protein